MAQQAIDELNAQIKKDIEAGGYGMSGPRGDDPPKKTNNENKIKHIVPPGLIFLGSKIVPKPGGVGGGGISGNKTSIVSKGLRAMDRSIQGFLKTKYKLPVKGFAHKILGTRGVGAAAGRLVPIAGWFLLEFDIFYNLGYYFGGGISNWFIPQVSVPDPPKPESLIENYMIENDLFDSE